MEGPFRQLPWGESNLKWISLPGTDNRYDVALSLLTDESEPQNSAERCHFSLHIKQRFNEKGVAVRCQIQLCSPGDADTEIILNFGEISLPFDKLDVGRWRVMYILLCQTY